MVIRIVLLIVVVIVPILGVITVEDLTNLTENNDQLVKTCETHSYVLEKSEAESERVEELVCSYAINNP